jgi:Cu(I)/Ag(I) efflux system membrane fusion protein
MRRLLLLTLGLGLVGCAKPAPSQTTTVGDLKLALSLEPDPPLAGDNQLLVTLRDASDRPVEGARVVLESRMAAMGAMPEMKGTGHTRALGNGRYAVTFPLQMNGDWTITLRIEAAGHPPVTSRLTVSPPRKGFALENRPTGGTTSGDAGAGSVLEVSPYRQQLLGVRFATAEKRELVRSFRGFGQVEVDERQLSEVTLKYEAFVESLAVAETGRAVRKGEALLTLYSPDLLAAEEEYLAASGRAGDEGETPLKAAAARRLRLWGLTDADLAALRARGRSEGRFTLRSPAGGVVLERNVVPGSRVTAGTVLYRIGNLGKVWIQAQFYESEAPFVAVGQPATISLPSLPGEEIEGRVSFIAPRVEEKTRTLLARIELPNPRSLLLPGMFANVRVSGSLGTVLAVPDAALLMSGEHRYAFVRRSDTQLQPVPVTTGASTGELTEIRSGLQEGDQVVVGPTFLLGSEAQLRDALPRWSPP